MDSSDFISIPPELAAKYQAAVAKRQQQSGALSAPPPIVKTVPVASKPVPQTKKGLEQYVEIVDDDAYDGTDIDEALALLKHAKYENGGFKTHDGKVVKSVLAYEALMGYRKIRVYRGMVKHATIDEISDDWALRWNREAELAFASSYPKS